MEKPNSIHALCRRDFLTGATAIAMAGGELPSVADMPSGRFEMTVINPEVVSGGAGLCVIMRTPAGKAYLFDAANGNSKKSPYMERKGTWKADAVVLHCHGLPDDRGSNIATMNPLPEVAIASLGNLNWMYCSGRSSVKIYSKMGIKAYATNLHGNVSVFSDGRKVDVSTDASNLSPERKRRRNGNRLLRMRTLCGAIFAACTLAVGAQTVETTPVPRQSVDTWGWWKRCGDIHNHLVKNKGTCYDVVFVGDSITHFWERAVDASGNGPYADLMREFKILNLGFAGDRTENVLWRFRCAGQLDGYKAKVFMLMIGTNNFNSTPCKPEDVRDGIVEIIHEIRSKHPESKILLLPVFVNGKAGSKPSAASRYMVLNENILPGLADGKTVFYQDINREFLASDGTIPDGLLCDGLHLTTRGYSIWRDAVLPFFMENAGIRKSR